VRDHSVQRSILQGALILTIAGIAAKVMGALYRIPFQNIAGDIGYYVYQQVYPIYGIAFALMMYGFPVIISKMVAESKETGSVSNNGNTVIISALVLGIIFTGLFFVVYYGSPIIAKHMKDPLLIPAIKAVSFTFLIIPVVSVLRGVYQGYGNMLPTGISQVMEQLSRVIFIIGASVIIASNGGSVYAIGSWAASGGVVGGIIAILTLFIFLQKNTLDIKLHGRVDLKKVLDVSKRLLVDGFAISIAASVLIVFQFIDAFAIPYLLTNGNIPSDTVKLQKGVYDRGQPLLQLGIVLATSISLSLVPYISQAFSKKDWRSISASSATALKIGLVLGGAAAAGLAIIINPTNIMLFENEAGSNVLGVLGVSILFATIALIAAAILQGIGKSTIVTKNVLIGGLSKVVLNIILLPNLGIMGAAIATVAGIAIISFLNLFVLFKNVPGLVTHRFNSIQIIFSLLIMVVLTFGWKELMFIILPAYESERLLAAFISFSTLLIGGVTYLICLMKANIWEESELHFLPGFIKQIDKNRKRKEQKV
jgi:polysaccharide transporter, PST family